MPKILHESLRHICGDSVGVGVHLSFLHDLQDKAVRIAQGVKQSFPVQGQPVKFAVEIKSIAKPVIKALDGKAKLVFSSIHVQIHVHAAEDAEIQLVTLDFKYKDVPGVITVVNGRFRLAMEKWNIPSCKSLNQNEENISKCFSEPEEYERFLYMLEVNSAQIIPDSIAENIDIPHLPSASSALRVAEPYEVGLVGNEYIVVYGKNWLIIPSSSDCGCDPDADNEVAIASQPVSSRSIGADKNGESIEQYFYKGEVTQNGISQHKPDVWQEKPKAFLYIPKSALFDYAYEAVKPSLSGTLNFDVLVAYADVYASIALKRFTIRNISLSPISSKISITAHLEVFSRVSTGVKVLCAKVEVLSFELKTDDSSPIVLHMGLNVGLHGQQLVVYSKLETSPVVELEMSGTFPLGLLAGLILEGVAERIVREKIVDVLNSLRITLFDFSKLGIPTNKNWKAIQSTEEHSILVSATEMG